MLDIRQGWTGDGLFGVEHTVAVRIIVLTTCHSFPPIDPSNCQISDLQTNTFDRTFQLSKIYFQDDKLSRPFQYVNLKMDKTKMHFNVNSVNRKSFYTLSGNIFRENIVDKNALIITNENFLISFVNNNWMKSCYWKVWREEQWLLLKHILLDAFSNFQFCNNMQIANNAQIII